MLSIRPSPWFSSFLSYTSTPLLLWFLLLIFLGFGVVWLLGNTSLKLDTLGALMKSIIMRDRGGEYGLEGNI